MESLLLSALLIIANLLGTGMIVPQLRRLHRQQATGGISAVWVGVGIAMNLWWLAYALRVGLLGLVPVSAVAGLLYVLIAERLVAIAGRATLRPLGLGMATIGVVPLPFLLAGDWALAGVAIGLCYGVQFAPAAVAAARATDVIGISPSTWIMAWVEAVIWLIYGASFGDAALIVGGGGGALMATVILFSLFRTAAPTGAWDPAVGTGRAELSAAG